MMSNESPFAPSSASSTPSSTAARQGATSIRPAASSCGDASARREGLDEGHVVLGAGSTELIDLVIRTFVAPGEEVLLSVPTFSMYEARARVCGGIPVLVPMTEEHEFDVVGHRLGGDRAHQGHLPLHAEQPTGNRMSEASMRRILRLGLPTAIDEAYHELGETPESLAHLWPSSPMRS